MQRRTQHRRWRLAIGIGLVAAVIASTWGIIYVAGTPYYRGKSVLHHWLYLVDSPDPADRTEAIEALCSGLKSRWQNDRTMCVKALAYYAPFHAPKELKAAAPALIETLKTDDYTYNRLTAAYTLGEIGPEAKEAIPALQEALRDEALDVRDEAARALKKIDPGVAADPAPPPIRSSANRPDPSQ